MDNNVTMSRLQSRIDILKNRFKKSHCKEIQRVLSEIDYIMSIYSAYKKMLQKRPCDIINNNPIITSWDKMLLNEYVIAIEKLIDVTNRYKLETLLTKKIMSIR